MTDPTAGDAGPLQAPSAGPIMPDLTGKVRRFAALNMAHDSVSGFPGGLAALGAAYDLVSMNVGQASSADLATIRLAGCFPLAYVNASFDASANLAVRYLLDAAGERVKSRGWGNFALDPEDPAWRALVLERCQAAVKAGWPGVMLDMCGPAPTQGGYLTPGPAIDPNTGQPFTPGGWMAATGALAGGIKAALGPGVAVVVNGLENGAWFPETKGLLAGVDGGLAESWLKRPGTAGHLDAGLWAASVAMLEDPTTTARAVCAMRKDWWPTGTSPDQEHLFSLASFLLGAGPLSFYEWSPSNTGPGVGLPRPPLEAVDLGPPLASVPSITGGFGARQFANGLVLANAGPEPVNVTLPAEPAQPPGPLAWWSWAEWETAHPLTWRDASTGMAPITAVTLAPATGGIYLLA